MEIRHEMSEPLLCICMSVRIWMCSSLSLRPYFCCLYMAINYDSSLTLPNKRSGSNITRGSCTHTHTHIQPKLKLAFTFFITAVGCVYSGLSECMNVYVCVSRKCAFHKFRTFYWMYALAQPISVHVDFVLRVCVHDDVYDALTDILKNTYISIRIRSWQTGRSSSLSATLFLALFLSWRTTTTIMAQAMTGSLHLQVVSLIKYTLFSTFINSSHDAVQTQNERCMLLFQA